MASQGAKAEHYHFSHALRAGEMTRQHPSVSAETVAKQIPYDKHTVSLGTPLLGLDPRSPGTWTLYSQMLPFIFSEAPAAASHRMSVPGLTFKDVQAFTSSPRVVSTETINHQLKAVVELLLKNQGQVAPNRERAVSDAVAATAEGAAEGDTRLQRALELLKANNSAQAEPLLRSVAEDKERAAASAGREAATAYRNLGAISGLADLKRAQEAYAHATALDPDNPDGLFWAGWFELETGDLHGAENFYTRLLQLDGKGATEDQILWARTGLGDIAVARGNLLDALTSYRDSLAIAERLAKADPGDAQRQRDLSLSYDNVGDVLEAQGNLPDALKAYRDSLGIRERLAGVDPSNAAWQIDVLRAQWRLAAHGDDAAQRWAFIVSTLRRLKSENKLTTEQASWLPMAEEELSKITARP